MKITIERKPNDPPLPVDYRSLSPERKIAILAEMGFVAIYEDHQPDCPALTGPGFNCICIPPGTSWAPPLDVREHLHETYEQLREQKAKARK